MKPELQGNLLTMCCNLYIKMQPVHLSKKKKQLFVERMQIGGLKIQRKANAACLLTKIIQFKLRFHIISFL